MRHSAGRFTFLAAGLLAFTALAQAAVFPSATYLVTVNTTSLNGMTGTIDLQFNAGALTSEVACATISYFSPDGALGTPATTTGNVTGTLGTSLTIDNGGNGCTPASTYTASTVNDYHQPITFGTTLSFLVAITSPAASPSNTSGSTFGLAFTAGGSPALTSDPSNFAGTITLNHDGTFSTAVLVGPGNIPSLVTIQAAELVTVQTSPTGLSFSVDSNAYTSSQTFPLAIGSMHTLSTTTPQGSAGTRQTFTSWSDGTTTSSDTITASTATTRYTANFSTSYLLTTSASPSADGSVGVNTASPTNDGYYPANTQLMLTASPASSSYVFTNWTGTLATTTNNPLSVTMTGPVTETANFGPSSVPVTINTSPQGLLVKVDNGTLTAAPITVPLTLGPHTITTTSPQGSNGTRYTFSNWSDGTTNISDPITVSLSTTSYTASFNTSYLLTTAVSPAGAGTVAVNTQSPTNDGYYPSGTPLTLTASPKSTYLFSSWTGTTNSSSNPLMITMNSPVSETANFVLPTTTVGTLSESPSVYGDPVQLIAHVSNGTSTPPNGGTVTFKMGSTVVGSGTVSNGVASYSMNGLQVSTGGNPTIAYYSGDSTDAPSQSVSFEFLVIAANTTTTVTYSPIPAVHNKNLTLTATVTPQYSGTPTGTVTFTENGGTPVTVTLVNGTATYSFDPSQAGTFTITAVYNPPVNGNFNVSSGSVRLTIQ